MPRVFRLARAARVRGPADLLSGEGARLHGGRWNHPGTPLVYAAAHVSLAVLESLVHSDVLPLDMVLVAYDLPDAPAAGVLPQASLPADWASYPAPRSTQDLGSAWVRSRSSVALGVPSAVVPAELNWLINPAHPDIGLVRARVLGPFRYDQRLRP